MAKVFLFVVGVAGAMAGVLMGGCGDDPAAPGPAADTTDAGAMCPSTYAVPAYQGSSTIPLPGTDTIEVGPGEQLTLALAGVPASGTDPTWRLDPAGNGNITPTGRDIDGRATALLRAPTTLADVDVFVDVPAQDGLPPCTVRLHIHVRMLPECAAAGLAVSACSTNVYLATSCAEGPIHAEHGNGGVQKYLFLRSTNGITGTAGIVEPQGGRLDPPLPNGAIGYRPPTQDGSYHLLVIGSRGGLPVCQSTIPIQIGDQRTDCNHYPATFRPRSTGRTQPFGPTAVDLDSTDLVQLTVTGPSDNLRATFTVTPTSVATISQIPNNLEAELTPRATQGTATVSVSITHAPEMPCIQTQTFNIRERSPGPKWNRVFPTATPTVSGSLVTQGGYVFGTGAMTGPGGAATVGAARIKADGTGFVQLTAPAATEQINSGLAGIGTNAYWPGLEGATWNVRTASAAASAQSVTSLGSTLPHSGMATDGTRLYWMEGDAIPGAFTTVFAGTLAQTNTKQQIYQAQFVAAGADPVQVANGYVYWAAFANVGGAAGTGVILRRRVDLTDANADVVLQAYPAGETYGGLAINDGFAVFGGFTFASGALTVRRQDLTTKVTSDVLVGRPVLKFVADNTYLYWLESVPGTGAELKRKAFGTAPNVDGTILASTPGQEGHSLAIDANAIYYTAGNSLYAMPKP